MNLVAPQGKGAGLVFPELFIGQGLAWVKKWVDKAHILQPPTGFFFQSLFSGKGTGMNCHQPSHCISGMGRTAGV